MEYEVESSRPRGRPKRTWKEVVREDCQARKLNKEDAVDRCKWTKVIKEVRWPGWVWAGECFFWYRPTRVVPDKRPLNGCCCRSLNNIRSVGLWKRLYDHQLANKVYFSDITVKAFLRVLPTRWRWKPAGIEITPLLPRVFFTLVNIYTNIVLISTELYLPLTFRSLSETFVRRSCSILLPVLATVVMWHGKKSVVRVAQCIAALVTVHGMPSLLSEVHCFLNPSGTSVRLPIQDCWFWPVDYVVVMACTTSVKADLFCSVLDDVFRIKQAVYTNKHYVQPNFIYLWRFGLCQHVLEAAAN